MEKAQALLRLKREGVNAPASWDGSAHSEAVEQRWKQGSKADKSDGKRQEGPKSQGIHEQVQLEEEKRMENVVVVVVVVENVVVVVVVVVENVVVVNIVVDVIAVIAVVRGKAWRWETASGAWGASVSYTHLRAHET